jgi:hypothetical protein
VSRGCRGERGGGAAQGFIVSAASWSYSKSRRCGLDRDKRRAVASSGGGDAGLLHCCTAAHGRCAMANNRLKAWDEDAKDH